MLEERVQPDSGLTRLVDVYCFSRGFREVGGSATMHNEGRRFVGAVEEANSDLIVLYREHRSDLVRLASLLTGSTPAAEDIVHDAFLAAQLRWTEIKNKEAYIRQSVVNGSRSHLRRLHVQRNAPQLRLSPALPADIDEIWQLVQRLPVRRRTVVVLHYYLDLSVDDIADLMNARPGTVKSLLHRGRETLRKQLS